MAATKGRMQAHQTEDDRQLAGERHYRVSVLKDEIIPDDHKLPDDNQPEGEKC